MSPAKEKKPAEKPAPAKAEESKKPAPLVVAVDSLCVGGILARKPKGTTLSDAAMKNLSKTKTQVVRKGQKDPVELTMLEAMRENGSLKTAAEFEAQIKEEKAQAAENTG